MFSGRLDALVFIVGVVIGTFAFAGFYGETIRYIMSIGEIIDGDTITDAYGISEPVILALLAAALVGIFYLGSWFEQRSTGPITAQAALSDD